MTMQQESRESVKSVQNTKVSGAKEVEALSSKMKKVSIASTVATHETIGSQTKSTKPVVPPYMKDNRKIFVGGLGKQVTNENFHQYFEQFGDIIDSIVMIDKETGRHRGFGFVTFADSDVARKVLAMGNEGKPTPQGGFTRGEVNIFDKMCEVKICEPKKGHQQGQMRNSTNQRDHNVVLNNENENHFSSKSTVSSATSVEKIPSNISFHSGHPNVYEDPQFGLGNASPQPYMLNPQFYPPEYFAQNIYPPAPTMVYGDGQYQYMPQVYHMQTYPMPMPCVDENGMYHYANYNSAGYYLNEQIAQPYSYPQSQIPSAESNDTNNASKKQEISQEKVA